MAFNFDELRRAANSAAKTKQREQEEEDAKWKRWRVEKAQRDFDTAFEKFTVEVEELVRKAVSNGETCILLKFDTTCEKREIPRSMACWTSHRHGWGCASQLAKTEWNYLTQQGFRVELKYLQRTTVCGGNVNGSRVTHKDWGTVIVAYFG